MMGEQKCQMIQYIGMMVQKEMMDCTMDMMHQMSGMK